MRWIERGHSQARRERERDAVSDLQMLKLWKNLLRIGDPSTDGAPRQQVFEPG